MKKMKKGEIFKVSNRDGDDYIVHAISRTIQKHGMFRKNYKNHNTRSNNSYNLKTFVFEDIQ